MACVFVQYSLTLNLTLMRAMTFDAMYVCLQGVMSICLLLVGNITLLLNCAMFVEVTSYLFCIIAFFIFRHKFANKPSYIKVCQITNYT